MLVFCLLEAWKFILKSDLYICIACTVVGPLPTALLFTVSVTPATVMPLLTYWQVSSSLSLGHGAGVIPLTLSHHRAFHHPCHHKRGEDSAVSCSERGDHIHRTFIKCIVTVVLFYYQLLLISYCA